MLAADEPEEPPGYRGRRRRRAPRAAVIVAAGTVALLVLVGAILLLAHRGSDPIAYGSARGSGTGGPDTTTSTRPARPPGAGSSPLRPAGTGSSPARPAPAWQANHRYGIGDRVSYAGHDYQCLQAHTSLPGWEPPDAPALWQPLP